MSLNLSSQTFSLFLTVSNDLLPGLNNTALLAWRKWSIQLPQNVNYEVFLHSIPRKEYISATPHRPVWKWCCCTGIFLEEISSTDQHRPRKLHVTVTFWYSTWKSRIFMSSGDGKSSLDNLFQWLRQHRCAL